MKKLLCGVALMGGLAGCSAPGLAEVEITSLELTAIPERRAVFIRLNAASPYSCSELSSGIQAELDGMPMRLSHPGGVTGGGLLDTRSHCAPMIFGLEVPEGVALPTLDGPTTSVRVWDGDRELAAEAENVCAERRLRVVTPASGVVRPGEWVDIAIEPGTDILAPYPSVLWMFGPWERQNITKVHERELTPQHLRFRAPDISGPGSDSVLVRLDKGSTPVLELSVPRCEGFGECKFNCAKWFQEGYPYLSVPLRVER